MNNTLGEALRLLRIKCGLKLREVESRSGVSNAYLSQLETGKIKKPSPEILRKLSEAYGEPHERLMVRAGYIERPDGPGADGVESLSRSQLLHALRLASVAMQTILEVHEQFGAYCDLAAKQFVEDEMLNLMGRLEVRLKFPDSPHSPAPCQPLSPGATD